jgi:hypothetical protein
MRILNVNEGASLEFHCVLKAKCITQIGLHNPSLVGMKVKEIGNDKKLRSNYFAESLLCSGI